MQFSRRTDWNTDSTPLARALAERRRRGLPVVDLTVSNPTRSGICYPDELLQPLLSPAVLDYDPDPRGQLRARQAIAAYYAQRNVVLDPARILLTTGTSEAYSFLFRLLCNPGEEVLVPAPGYPLFDYLADAESVRLLATPLIYDHGWQLDLTALEAVITPRTRAVILVHPNNPTGHFTSQAESTALFEICCRHRLALIVDEVFLDYPLVDVSAADAASFLARPAPVPVFVVSGISKILGLPQMKLAWLAVAHPAADGLDSVVESIAQAALERLEVLADTFLSVGTPVQVALPEWLAHAPAIQSQILTRIGSNLAALDAALAAQPVALVSRLRAQAGWYAILRIPALRPDEETALLLLERGLWTHPGSFFSIPSSGWLVVSLLTPPTEFAIGICQLLSAIAEQALGQH